MNRPFNQNCERFEVMIGEWFDQSLPDSDGPELTAHLSTCASCRESFELSARIEAGLVSRSAEVPAIEAFLPAMAMAPARAAAHPHLLRAFRALMSPAGVATVLVLWGTLLAVRFSEPIAAWLTRISSEELDVYSRDIANVLLEVSHVDMVTLIAVYVALALAVLASTGAITLRYIRNS